MTESNGNGRTFLTADAILKKDDIKIEPLHIPEWGENCWVHVRSLMGIERDAFEASMVDLRGRTKKLSHENFRARFVVKVLCDETGNQLFKDSQAAELGKKNSAALSRIYNLGSKLSQMTDEDVDELVGN